jgi:hypothetical protein
MGIDLLSWATILSVAVVGALFGIPNSWLFRDESGLGVNLLCGSAILAVVVMSALLALDVLGGCIDGSTCLWLGLLLGITG